MAMSGQQDGKAKQRQTFLTVKQFAAELGLAEVTVRVWLAARKLAFVRFGRAVRIPVSEIQRLVDEGMNPAQGH